MFLAIFCVCQTLVWTIVYQGFLAFQRSLIEYDVVYEEIGEIISCGYGVAMRNGSAQAKKAAKYISDYTNNEQGVLRFINSFFG